MILVFFVIIILLVYLSHKKKEDFTATNIKYITKLDSNKPAIILGTSESILHYIHDLKRLKNTGKYQFISFGNSFEFFIEYLNFEPDYYFFMDPHSSLYTIDYLLRNNKSQVKFVICDVFINKSRNELNNNLGSSIIISEKLWNKYINDIKKIKNKYLIKTKFNSSTKREIVNCLFKDTEFTKNLYLTSCYKFKGQENDVFIKDKLVLFVIPLIIFLKIPNIYILGFDLKGGRFNNRKNIISGKSLQILFKKFIPTIKYLNIILEKKNYSLKNLVEDKYTNINKYVLYKNIKEL